jgi:hypothetical protein
MAPPLGKNKNKFNIPDYLFALGPLAGLLFQQDVPEAPNLSDAGIDPKKIRSFFDLKRSVSRAGVQRQGATAARTAATSLPSALRQSTVPASVSAGIQTKIADQLAQLDAQLAGEELQASFQVYDAMLKQFQAQMAESQAKGGPFGDAFEILSFLPLVA